jgi:hypothetical protein
MRKIWLCVAASLMAWAAPAAAQPDNPDTTLSPAHLKQNWTQIERDLMYNVSQGSQIMRFDWWRALERADSQELFGADGLARFGYLPRPRTLINGTGLPVGFTSDRDSRGRWLSMNCTACHTNRVRYNGTVYQIDGAPGFGDLSGFIAALADALDATVNDPAKFARFAARLHAKPDALRPQLQTEAAAFRKFADNSKPGTPWGPGRVDAFGMIFNRVTAIDLNIDANSHTPDAPVSLPFLWTTNMQDKIQWNAMIPNARSFERLARNVGQVLGVFGKMPGLHDADAFRRLKMLNSVRTAHLLWVDLKISELQPPPWIGPMPSDAQISAGKRIYNQNCASCHVDTRAPLEAFHWPCKYWNGPGPAYADGILRICPVPVSELGTDDRTVKNISSYSAATGVLEGYAPLPGFAPLPARASGGDVLRPVVIGAILDNQLAQPDDQPMPATAMAISGSGGHLAGARAAVLAQANDANSYIAKQADADFLVYKGGPLNGIWATSPYLHNGSVPNLADLLKPVAQRPVTFEIGSRDLDVDNVGYVSAAASGRFVFDTRKPGNSNAGHTYGTGLSTEDKNNLLQYLKTL